MFEIVMKRKNLDKRFRPCPAFTTDQPYKNHCTFETRQEAERHLNALIFRHGTDMVAFKVVKFHKTEASA